MKPKFTTDALEIAIAHAGDTPELRRKIEEGTQRLRIAEQIYAMRTRAKLTQTQLAKRIGTKQSAIARLESADYEGHSFAIVHRIARALDCGIRFDFYPLHSKAPRPRIEAKKTVSRKSRLRSAV